MDKKFLQVITCIAFAIGTFGFGSPTIGCKSDDDCPKGYVCEDVFVISWFAGGTCRRGSGVGEVNKKGTQPWVKKHSGH